MEECRAETVALYCTSFHCPSLNIFKEYNPVASNLDILKIFKVKTLISNRSVALKDYNWWCIQYTDKQEIEDIQYITFLIMARSGLRALEFYDPATGKHGQAHMQARYATHSVIFYINRILALWYRLGITQHLIRSGIARLEEVRDENGTLENLYVRVCIKTFGMFVCHVI